MERNTKQKELIHDALKANDEFISAQDLHRKLEDEGVKVGLATADGLETLTPPIKMSLEESLDFANEDECVEVTPESIRVRKIILSREDWYKWRAKQRRQNNAQNNK